MKRFRPASLLAACLLLATGDAAVEQNPTSAAQNATKSQPKSQSKSGGAAAAGDSRLTKAEVEVLIDKDGRTPPAWFSTTPLNFPKTLDLSWPEPAPQPWNNQKNVGQYIWDVINPNPSRWREGIRLLHHLLQMHKDDPEKREKVMLTLGHIYQNLLADYARAAFWLQKAGAADVDEYPTSAIHLAECYWKLGSRSAAMELLDQIKPPRFKMTKLLADMGETDRALEIAKSYFGDKDPEDAYLAAGDACRVAGRLPEAIGYYEKLIDATRGNDGNRQRKFRERVQASLDAIRLFELSDVKKVRDGKYRDSSLGYEGQVHVEVVVKNRRIDSVQVVQHKEKQFYSSIDDTTRKIIEKQSVKGVDATSAATITSEAIINATAKALSTGAK